MEMAAGDGRWWWGGGAAVVVVGRRGGVAARREVTIASGGNSSAGRVGCRSAWEAGGGAARGTPGGVRRLTDDGTEVGRRGALATAATEAVGDGRARDRQTETERHRHTAALAAVDGWTRARWPSAALQSTNG